jgi:hypothetical protein
VITLIRICCPACQARIKAPIQLSGCVRPCPQCGNPVRVTVLPPEDQGPVLLIEDRLGILRSGPALQAR